MPSDLKLGFVCHEGLASFITPIAEICSTFYHTQTCFKNDKELLERVVSWSDVLWIEWANELAVNITQVNGLLKDKKKVIVRLHSYEVFVREFLTNIQWQNVTDIVFVAPHIKELFERQVKLGSSIKNHVIPNGVDCDKFQLKKILTPNKKLAFLAHLGYRKDPQLLLHAYQCLNIVDSSFELHLGGRIDEPRYFLYYEQMVKEMNLEGKVFIHGPVNPIQFLQDKTYIVCTSVLEGHPVGIMEAMAMGLKPLIHRYYQGTESYWPETYQWRTMSDFVRMARNGVNPKEYRQFILDRFNICDQIDRIREMIE